MRITRIVLKNFSSIWAAMSLKELEIDFTKCKNPLVLIVGKNGSGKTSLLSNLHPFASLGSLDVRNSSDLILDGKSGLKIFEFQNDNHSYICEHRYLWNNGKRTTKSFFRKDGVELNEAGHVSDFNDLISFEFGIDQGFLKLIRLGPNVTDFINLKASDRKAYVGNLLSDLNIYNKLYKKITEERKLIKNQMKSLVIRMNTYIPERDKLDDLLKTSKDNVTKFKDDLEKMVLLTGQLDGHLSSIKNKISKNSKLLEYYDEHKKLFFMYDEIVSKYDNFLEYFTKKNNSNLKLKNELEDCLTKIKNIESEIARITKDNTNLENKIKILLKDKDSTIHSDKIDEIKSQLTEEDLNIPMNELEKANELYPTYLMAYKNISSLTSDIKEIIGIDTNAIFVIKENLIGMDVRTNKFISQVKSILNEKANIIHDNISRFKIQKENLNKDKGVVLFVPNDCECYRNCPYYMALEAPPMNKKDYNDGIMEMEIALEVLDNAVNILDRIDYLYKMIDSFNELVKSINIAPINKGKLVTTIINLDLSYINEYNKNIHDSYLYNVASRDIYNMRKLLLEYTKYIDELSHNVEYVCAKRDLETNSSKLKELSDQLTILEDIKEGCELKLSESDTELNDLKYYYDAYMEYIGNLSHYQEIRKAKEDINKDIAEYQDKSKELETYKKMIYKIRFDLDDAESKVSKYIMLKNMADQIDKEQETLALRLKHAELIAKALSTTTGIPVKFMNLYLQNIQAVANHIIHDMFNEALTLLPIEISETTFNIPYAINGIVIEDVQHASQGERSIISIALSFAILNQFMSLYNIILLDEMDGPLYKDNKFKFLRILESQMKSIKAEQIVLITHSDIFEEYPIDLIITSPDFDMGNYNQANIIWQR